LASFEKDYTGMHGQQNIKKCYVWMRRLLYDISATEDRQIWKRMIKCHVGSFMKLAAAFPGLVYLVNAPIILNCTGKM